MKLKKKKKPAGFDGLLDTPNVTLLSCTVNMMTHRWVLVYLLSRHLDDSLIGDSLHIVMPCIFLRKTDEAQFDDAVRCSSYKS